MRKFTGTIGRCFVFCKASKLGDASLLSALWDFDSGGIHTFAIPLMAIDDTGIPPTHYGASTVVDVEMDSDIKLTGPTVTKYFSVDGWTWETALLDMYLKELPDEPLI